MDGKDFETLSSRLMGAAFTFEGCADRLQEAPGPRSMSRGLSIYALVSLLSMSEIIHGVISELGAGRLPNGARLVRHLWEYSVEFLYVVQDPEPRLAQFMISYARRAEGAPPLEGMDPGLYAESFPDATRSDLAKDIAAARQEEADRRETLGRPLLPHEKADIPSIKEMAACVGLAAAYEASYRRLSHLAHPGLWGMSRYVLISPQGEVERLDKEQQGTAASRERAAFMAFHGLVCARRVCRALWEAAPELHPALAQYLGETG